MDISDFMIGDFAAMGAICFTNPLEVNYLAARGSYVEPYKGISDALITVIRCDGWSTLEKGLVPALHFQFILNSVRLGVYNTAMSNKWMYNRNGDVSFFRGMLWGAAGSFCASPFYMKKVGSLICSSTQITTFGKAKSMLREYEIVTQPILNTLTAAFVAGSVVALAITLPDVISTRLYNQNTDTFGKGILYKGWWDCAQKVFRFEVLQGLYKGFWANYLRQAPHSILLLLFFDSLISARDKYQSI